MDKLFKLIKTLKKNTEDWGKDSRSSIVNFIPKKKAN